MRFIQKVHNSLLTQTVQVQNLNFVALEQVIVMVVCWIMSNFSITILVEVTKQILVDTLLFLFLFISFYFLLFFISIYNLNFVLVLKFNNIVFDNFDNFC